jgi:hypothetical protein
MLHVSTIAQVSIVCRGLALRAAEHVRTSRLKRFVDEY